MTRMASVIKRAEVVTIRDRRPERPAPTAVFASAKGAWCTDIEGNKYVDLTASSGAVLLGHGDASVAQVVIEAMRAGTVSLADTVTIPLVEVAERLVTRYPAAERVAFFRTGSEATTAAVRLVRAATNRHWILSSGYHGWHDWQLGIRGFNVNISHGVIHFGYHVEALGMLLDKLSEQVAGVIVSPEPAWVSMEVLSSMSDVCQKHGVPFILDEVMTGLRYGPSGVNGSGIAADVIVLAKGLANGHSIAAVAGQDDIVSFYHAANIGGTYNREVLPLVAARVVLDATESGVVHQRASEAGTSIRDGIAAALRQAGVPVWVGGPPLMFDIVMPTVAVADVFFTTMFECGVHMDRTGTQFVTGAHTDREVDVVLAAAEKAASVIADRFGALPEVDDQRLRDFAWDAFGGAMMVQSDWRVDIKRILAAVGGG